MAEASELITIASIIAGFGIAMLFFRIQRELQMQNQGERNWIPWADRLLVGATLLSLVFVILPVTLIRSRNSPWAILPKAGASAASTLVAGYVFAILAHYRLFFGNKRNGPRSNPEPAEKLWVCVSILFAVIVAVWVILLRWPLL